MRPTFAVAPAEYLQTLSNAAGTDNCAREAQPVGPVFWQRGLSASARLHAQAMRDSAGRCFQHDSCPASCPALGNVGSLRALFPFLMRQCAWTTRLWRFYRKALVGENIASNGFSPLSIMDHWIKNRGQCSNLLASSFTEAAVAEAAPIIVQVCNLGGLFLGLPFTIQSQNFGGAQPTDYDTPLIIGSHLTPRESKPISSNLHFILVYYGYQAPMVRRRLKSVTPLSIDHRVRRFVSEAKYLT